MEGEREREMMMMMMIPFLHHLDMMSSGVDIVQHQEDFIFWREEELCMP